MFKKMRWYISLPWRAVRRVARVAGVGIIYLRCTLLQKRHPNIVVSADIFKKLYLGVTGRYQDIHSTQEAKNKNEEIKKLFQTDLDGTGSLVKSGLPLVKFPSFSNTQDVMVNEIREILFEDSYNQFNVNFKDNDVILDCGGNIGVFAIYAGKKIHELHGHGKVICLEPVPQFAKILAGNIQRAHETFPEVTFQVISRAASDKKESAIIHINNDCFTATSLFTERAPHGTPLTIECQPIDELVQELKLPHIDFIKMDIEGAEVKALRGAAKTIREFKPRLAISAYHFFWDIYDIPKIIQEIRPDYNIRVVRGLGPMCYAW